MRSRRFRPLLASIAALALIAGTVSACGSDDDEGSSSTTASGDKTYHFVISNNFLGNDWRPQVERLASLTTAFPPFKGKVTVESVNAEPTTEAQIASVNSIIQEKPDALLLISSSDSALNPAVKRACAAGIVVVTVSTPITEPCAWNVSQDFKAGMVSVGQWMGKVLTKSGGNGVFVDRGLPGLGSSKDIENGFLEGLKQTAPAVEAIGKYDGNYAQGPTQQGVSNLLVGKKDVDGVMSQGYCTPVFNAFGQAGLDTVPTTCFAYNGELTACAAEQTCALLSGSPVAMQIAMEVALDALEGKQTPPKDELVPVPMTLFVTPGSPTDVGSDLVEVETLAAGRNYFPNLPPGLALPYTLPAYPIEPELAAGAGA